MESSYIHYSTSLLWKLEKFFGSFQFFVSFNIVFNIVKETEKSAEMVG